jgi:hypothetical protein
MITQGYPKELQIQKLGQLVVWRKQLARGQGRRPRGWRSYDTSRPEPVNLKPQEMKGPHIRTEPKEDEVGERSENHHQ